MMVFVILINLYTTSYILTNNHFIIFTNIYIKYILSIYIFIYFIKKKIN